MAAQIAAIIIFVAMFIMIVFDVVERHIVTLASGLLVLTVVFGIFMHSWTAIWDTLNFSPIFKLPFWYGEAEESTSGVNWSTIIFILGMMVMVEGMGLSGFFRWLCLKIAGAVKYKTVPILVCFMIMAGVLSMFIDSITVILFLAAVTAELARLLKFNPVPMIIAEIFCANLGGSATMCGDPPNIIIGTSFGFSFFDFLTNTGVIAAICFVVILFYFFLCFRKDLKKSELERGDDIQVMDAKDAITNKTAFVFPIIVFAISVVLLITHAQTTLSVATIGVIAAILTVITTFIASGRDGIVHIIKHIDYKTILFFVGLFISVGGLEQTGALEAVAGFIEKVSGGNIIAVSAIILWLSAIASAFIDNIPFAATMVPVVKLMNQAGMPLDVLAYSLSIGTDIGGNGTPIGASANVVGTSVAAKEGHPISWGTYCKYCVPATIIVLAMSTVCILFKYNLI